MKKSSKEIRLEKIKMELNNFDLLAPGRLRETLMKCGNKSCPCHKNKNARHGPYHLWDRKVGKKLTSKMVSETQAKQIQSWINRRKSFEKLVVEIQIISQELILERHKCSAFFHGITPAISFAKARDVFLRLWLGSNNSCS